MPSIFTFLMSNMVMYRSNNDNKVDGRDIWFRIRPNLGLFGHFDKFWGPSIS